MKKLFELGFIMLVCLLILVIAGCQNIVYRRYAEINAHNKHLVSYRDGRYYANVIEESSKDGVRDFSDQKAFTLSMFNAVGK